jgi:hypothetical protein
MTATVVIPLARNGNGVALRVVRHPGAELRIHLQHLVHVFEPAWTRFVEPHLRPRVDEPWIDVGARGVDDLRARGHRHVRADGFDLLPADHDRAALDVRLRDRMNARVRDRRDRLRAGLLRRLPGGWLRCRATGCPGRLLRLALRLRTAHPLLPRRLRFLRVRGRRTRRALLR